jgi:FdhD protein
MRTPGDDIDLVHGFLLTEGIIEQRNDIRTAQYCAGDVGEGNTYNVIDVALAEGVAAPDVSLERSFYTTSSCGVCGKASIDAIRVRARHDVAADDLVITPEALAALPATLRTAQRVFDRTGGLHAAGLFTAEGTLLALREDVGRHNAVDKVVGQLLRNDSVPGHGVVLLVSGRASFELVQKALLAGISTLAAVSAPSSLAVDLAEESGMTLIGFLRGETMNVYAGSHRVGLGVSTGAVSPP